MARILLCCLSKANPQRDRCGYEKSHYRNSDGALPDHGFRGLRAGKISIPGFDARRVGCQGICIPKRFRRPDAPSTAGPGCLHFFVDGHSVFLRDGHCRCLCQAPHLYVVRFLMNHFRFNLRGCLLVPGFVRLHGDGIVFWSSRALFLKVRVSLDGESPWTTGPP